MKHLLLVILIFLFASFANAGSFSGGMSGAHGGSGSMNVIIFTCDDCYWKNIAATNEGAFVAPGPANTPTIDLLAAEGISFPRAAAGPQCTPSRVLMNTGQYNFRNGYWPAPGSGVIENTPWLAAAYTDGVENSYAAGVGKMGLFFDVESSTPPVTDIFLTGFSRWIGRSGNFVSYDNSSGTDLSEFRSPQEQSRDWSAGTHATANTVSDFQTILNEYRASNLEDPFLFWVSFNVNHFNSPNPSMPDPSGGAPWTACTLATDDHCIIDMIEHDPLGLDSGIRDVLALLTPTELRNTCIIYASDNGPEPEYFDVPTSRGKGSPWSYWSSGRVGAIFSGACVPENQKGKDGLAIVSLLDIFPTVAELADFNMPPGHTFDGISLRNLLEGDCDTSLCDDLPGRDYYLVESGDRFSIVYEDLSYELHATYDGLTSELYKVITDEFEQTDLCAGDCTAVALNAQDEAACEALSTAAANISTLINFQLDCSDETPPSLPTGLNCTPGDTEFTCSWSHADPSDVDHFESRWECGGGYTDINPDTSPTTVQGLTNDVPCTFDVRAVDAAGNPSAYVTDSVTPTAGGGAQLYDDPTKNIFSTYDPLCDGTNPEIVFCDGFEDGTFVTGPGTNDSATGDYWVWSGEETDPQGTNYAECGGTNPNRAEFGIAGTSCTASKGWVNRNYGTSDPDGSGSVGGKVDGYHRAKISGGNPAAAAQVSDHFSIRLGIKFASDTSTRCVGAGAGDNPCDQDAYDFTLRGTNGHKGIVTCTSTSCGLGHTVEIQTWNGWCSGCNVGDYTVTAPNIGTYQQMLGVTPSTNVGWYPAGNVQDADIYGSQKSTPAELDHRSYPDEWIWLEFEVHAIDTNGFFRVWADSCGKDGKGCTATQTLIIEKTGLDLEAISGDEFSWVWINFWGRGQRGEIQFDEIVIKDRSCGGCDSNIGWMSNL